MLPLCACILEGAMADWAAVVLRLEHGAEAALTGAGFGIFSFVMATTRLSGDSLIDRFGPVFLARLCGIAGIAGLVLLWLAPHIWLSLIGFALMGFASSLIFPMSVTAAARQPGRSSAMNIAALSLICFSGYVIGPPVVGFIAGVVGLKGALACLIPFAVGVLLLAQRIAPRTAAQPA